MNSQQVSELMKELKLLAMCDQYQQEQKGTNAHTMTYDDRLGRSLQVQIVYNAQKRFERFVKASKIKQCNAAIEDTIYDSRRNLDKNQMHPLTTCQWAKSNQHIVFIGPTGIGKSWLASALAIEAIRKGMRVIYKRLPVLLDEMEVARAEGLLIKYRNSIAKFPILIIDDFGLSKLSNRARHDLLEIIEDKSGSGSIIITSQLPINKWHDYIGEPTIADAIVDRIVHRAHVIDIQGESMRRQQK